MVGPRLSDDVSSLNRCSRLVGDGAPPDGRDSPTVGGIGIRLESPAANGFQTTLEVLDTVDPALRDDGAGGNGRRHWFSIGLLPDPTKESVDDRFHDPHLFRRFR